MGNNQNWTNTGEQIKNALADALNTGDFKNLNNVVAQSVTTALNEAGINMNNPIGGSRSHSQSSSQSFGGFTQNSSQSFSSS